MSIGHVISGDILFSGRRGARGFVGVESWRTAPGWGITLILLILIIFPALCYVIGVKCFPPVKQNGNNNGGRVIVVDRFEQVKTEVLILLQEPRHRVGQRSIWSRQPFGRGESCKLLFYGNILQDVDLLRSGTARRPLKKQTVSKWSERETRTSSALCCSCSTTNLDSSSSTLASPDFLVFTLRRDQSSSTVCGSTSKHTSCKTATNESSSTTTSTCDRCLLPRLRHSLDCSCKLCNQPVVVFLVVDFRMWTNEVFRHSQPPPQTLATAWPNRHQPRHQVSLSVYNNFQSR